MRKPPALALLLSIVCFLLVSAPADATTARGTLLFGMNGGPGVLGHLTLSNLSPTLPLQFRFGLGYASMEPGKAEDARRVFINDNNGGTPQKNGHLWSLGFDLVFPLSTKASRRLEGYAGPRYGMFDAHFRYVGDNEEFDVTGNSWGVGAGLEGTADINPRFALILSGGAEYFGRGDLHGHDATYSPDNDNVNSRKDYAYKDADEAINQPEH